MAVAKASWTTFLFLLIALVSSEEHPGWEEVLRMQEDALRASEHATELQRRAIEITRRAREASEGCAQESCRMQDMKRDTQAKMPEANYISSDLRMARLVAKKGSAWEESFEMQAMLQLEEEATAVALWPKPDRKGLPKYMASADSKGNLNVFDFLGNSLLAWNSNEEKRKLPQEKPEASAGVTSMQFLDMYERGRVVLVLGYGDGTMTVFWVEESRTKDPDNPRRYRSSFDLTSRSRMLPSRKLGAITLAALVLIGSSRKILGVDKTGNIALFDLVTGAFEGVLTAPSKVLLLRGRITPLLFLSNGIAKLDPKTMEIQILDCKGLNGTNLLAVQQDPLASARFYALTEEMEILTLYASIDSRVPNACRVRTGVPSGFLPGSDWFSMAAVRNYVLVANTGSVAVFNTSMAKRGMYGVIPTLKEEAHTIGRLLDVQTSSNLIQVLAGNSDHGMVLGLQGRYLATFRSILPQPPKYKNRKKILLIGQPLLIFGMAIFVYLQYRSKRSKFMNDYEKEERLAEMYEKMNEMRAPQHFNQGAGSAGTSKRRSNFSAEQPSYAPGQSSQAHDMSDRTRMMEKLANLHAELNRTPPSPFRKEHGKKET